ncbi:MAG: succinyl-diaminopimelate desuccinylase [Polyangiales bacterium]
MPELRKAIAKTLLDLVSIESPIGFEKAICDHVEKRLRRTLPADAIHRFHDSLIVRANVRPNAPKVALVGHLDTVATVHDQPPRIEGDRLFGAGAADMKSGLALMIELVERLDLGRIPYELVLIFYEAEEGPYDGNRLGPILDHFTSLHQLDLAICLEPSDNQMQLGAMGAIHATAVFHGRTAHSARPWQGENAFYKAAKFLVELSEREPLEVMVEGHRYVEVVTPTIISGGRARNVVPDRCELNLNYRFAPNKSLETAVNELRVMLGDRGDLEPTDLSPAGRPHANNPLVKHLASCGVTDVRAKQAWTDVARFDAIGVPGVNLGPGIAAQAHQRNEYTDLPALFEGYRIFERFLTTGSNLG